MRYSNQVFQVAQAAVAAAAGSSATVPSSLRQPTQSAYPGAPPGLAPSPYSLPPPHLSIPLPPTPAAPANQHSGYPPGAPPTLQLGANQMAFNPAMAPPMVSPLGGGAGAGQKPRQSIDDAIASLSAQFGLKPVWFSCLLSDFVVFGRYFRLKIRQI